LLPPDYVDRAVLSEEVHARPPEVLQTPSRVTYLAVLIEPEARAREFAHLVQLCELHRIVPPLSDANHFVADFGPLRLKWERHSEFSSYTFITRGRSPRPFSQPPILQLPAGWLADIPGRTLFAAHAKVIAAGPSEPDADFLAEHFDDHVVVGAEVGGGAGLAYTDFKVRADGFGRFLVLDRSLTARQAGRMVQRLFEVEAYRMMALLAFPLVRPLSALLATSEQALASLTAELTSPGVDDVDSRREQR
jgi:uncharacterized membrane-anchored protein